MCSTIVGFTHLNMSLFTKTKLTMRDVNLISFFSVIIKSTFHLNSNKIHTTNVLYD